MTVSEHRVKCAERITTVRIFSVHCRSAPRRSPTAAMTAKEKQLAAVSAAAGKPAARLPLLKQLGPGLITGAADDDPSGIASYSQAGAQVRLRMLWAGFFSLPLTIRLPNLSARIRPVDPDRPSAHPPAHY